MTKRVLNNSIKKPLRVSANTLLFGNASAIDATLLTQIDRDVSDVKPQSTQDFVDSLISRQSKIIDAAIHSQTAIDEDNLRKRYATYAWLKLNFDNESKLTWMTIPAPRNRCPFRYETQIKTTYFCCHEMDSSTESVIRRTETYQTNTIKRGGYRYDWRYWC